jgi:TolB protein
MRAFALADFGGFSNVIQMNVESNGWKWSGLRSAHVVFLASLAAFAFTLGSPLYGQGGKTILLGTIEAELKKKQVPLDLGKTPKSLALLIAKAVSVHGGLRLAHPNQSRYSVYFSPLGGNQVKVEISKGASDTPKKLYKSFVVQGNSIDEVVLKGCDGMVQAILGMPGFFSGKICYLSKLSGNKEIFVSNSLMTSAQPHTSFKKITFNPSWDNAGKGIFFTSNRKVFNNIEHLDIASRRISIIANYRGSNLRAVQNPRNSEVAMILSTSGNPEVWLAATPKSKPKRITRNKSNESGPCWSSDGRRLIVTSDSRGKPQLYEVSLSSGRLTRIPTNISSHCTEASWNPSDPTKIAFTAAVGGGFQIYEYSFSSRTSRALTGGRNHGMQPCWANDGRHLFFTERSSAGGTRLMVLDTELQGSKPVALHGASFGSCSQVSFHYPR